MGAHAGKVNPGFPDAREARERSQRCPQPVTASIPFGSWLRVPASAWSGRWLMALLAATRIAYESYGRRWRKAEGSWVKRSDIEFAEAEIAVSWLELSGSARSRRLGLQLSVYDHICTTYAPRMPQAERFLQTQDSTQVLKPITSEQVGSRVRGSGLDSDPGGAGSSGEAGFFGGEGRRRGDFGGAQALHRYTH